MRAIDEANRRLTKAIMEAEKHLDHLQNIREAARQRRRLTAAIEAIVTYLGKDSSLLDVVVWVGLAGVFLGHIA